MPPTQFERDTTYRLLAEAVRFLLIAQHQADGTLPPPLKCWVYADTIGWGNPVGPRELAPLRGKRIEIEVRVVDYP